MPIYDYRCDHCGHVFSAVQSFKDDALEKCPSCGKKPRRLLSMPAIVFKGSGWYKTDSRPSQKGSDGAGADSKSDTSKSDTKVETKSDSKTDAKGGETKSDTKSDSKTGTKSDK